MQVLVRFLATVARLMIAAVLAYGFTVGYCLSFLAGVLCGHNALIPLLLFFAVIFAVMEIVAARRRARSPGRGGAGDNRTS
jgi:uncharacterized membrane protein